MVGGGLGDPYFFLHISFSWVKIRLHTENQLPTLSGSALKVVMWGGVGWWVVRPYSKLSTLNKGFSIKATETSLLNEGYST